MIIRDFNKAAIITHDGEVSYRQLMGNILSYADMMPKAEQFSLAEGEKMKTLILSENRSEWIYAFFAVWHNEAIAVPVDATSTVHDVAYIMNDCRPQCIFTSREKEQLARDAMREAGVEMTVIVFEDNVPEPRDVAEGQEFRFENTSGKVEPCLIIYTSGTTGSPKGVMLSYENLEANIHGVADEVPIFNGNRRTLILLPLHHVLPLMGTAIAPITRGCGVAICPSLSGPDIMDTLKRGEIAIMVGVPRLWQTLYTGIMKKIEASAVTRALFNMCKKAQNRRLSRFVFQAVHKKMGGHLDYCVCGGAALDREIGEGLKTLGLEVLEGYGMTEMAPIIAFTRPGDYIPGCAGLPLPSVECKIVGGELLAKGKNLMMGYYNRPEETAEVIDSDGFLHTGDLAEVDEKGRVYLTGRSKEIIVLSNGKNVQPSEIEYKLEKYDSQVKEAAVVQDGDMLRAIIVPQEEWLGTMTDADAEARLKREVLEPYNLTVANYKKLMNVSIYRGELPRTKLEKLQRYKLKELLEKTPAPAQKVEEAPTSVENVSGTLATLKAYIEKEKKTEVTAEAHIETDLGFDSLDRVSLQDFIEERFSVSINADDIASYKNIGEIADAIDAKKKAPAHITQPADAPLKLPTSAFTHPLISKSFTGFCRLHNSLKVKGKENIPVNGPVIVAPNHQSFLDGPLTMAGMNWGDISNYYFYATEEHVQGSLRRWFAARHNIILMERRNLKNSIQKMAEVLRMGKNLVIFPEGRRTNTGALGDFKKTFAILSQDLNVPILPVCIRGAYDALPRERTMPSTAHIEIEYLPVVQPSEAATPEALAELVRQRINDVLGS
ncbi:MAG: AMP-binding protein [Prevotella sp.]|nr:AMP-binding protein [Prevotella sp.]